MPASLISCQVPGVMSCKVSCVIFAFLSLLQIIKQKVKSVVKLAGGGLVIDRAKQDTH